MNQLRLKQGFTAENYFASTGLSISTLEPALSESLQQGLLINQDDRYFCSEQGWNFMDNILEKFMP